MPKVSVAFFSSAAVLILLGIVWTTVMGSLGDFALSTVRDQLQIEALLMGMMGAFYALATSRLLGRLPAVSFILTLAGVALLTPGQCLLVLARPERPPLAILLALLGTLGGLTGVICFAVVVFSFWGRQPAPN